MLLVESKEQGLTGGVAVTVIVHGAGPAAEVNAARARDAAS